MKLISVFLNLFLIIFSGNLLAAKLEFAQWLPYVVIESQIAKSISMSSISEQNIGLQWQDWTPSISFVKLDLDLTSFQVNASQAGLSASNSGSLQTGAGARLQVGAFNLDQTVIREFGGNQIALRIKATCQPFEINASSININLNAPFVRSGGDIYPVVDQVDLQFNSAPSISSIQCEGPTGFDSRITDLVKSTLQNHDVLQNFLKSYINKNIKEKIISEWQKLIQRSLPELKLARTFAPSALGIFIIFTYDLKIGPESELISLVDSDIMAPSLRPNIPKIAIPERSLSRLIELKMSEYRINGYNLQQIPSFAKFMNNRLIQLFVWSDMLHYSRKSAFNLNLNKLDSVSVNPDGKGQWIAKFQALGNINSTRKGQVWDFMEWSLGIASQLGIKVEKGKLEISSVNRVSSANFRYGIDYIQKFSPGSPSKKILSKAIDAAVSDQSFNVDLPQLNLQGSQWSLDNSSSDGKNIWIDWID